MADKPNKWTQPDSPPPPMFIGSKERDLVKNINDEIIEKMIGQQILYYAINIEKTNVHPLYGEAIVKNFYPPIRVYALIEWQGEETTTDIFGIDRRAKITVHFHKRRLTEEQNLFVSEGDFVRYGDDFFEIVELNQPKQMFGQTGKETEIVAKCVRAREGMFSP